MKYLPSRVSLNFLSELKKIKNILREFLYVVKQEKIEKVRLYID